MKTIPFEMVFSICDKYVPSGDNCNNRMYWLRIKCL